MEKEIKITLKLYKCRDTAKRFFRDEYAEKLKPYKDLVQAVMKANGLEEIPALLKISKTNAYQDNPMSQMLFMAATVELIEPSE